MIPIPFAELQALLAPKGIDLQKQLDDHVAFMVRSGAVKEKDADQYRDNFQTISVRKSELEAIPQGYKPMLFVDDMTPTESAKAFDIPSFGQMLSNFTKRDPNNPEISLPNQSPSGLARLTFSPNVGDLTPGHLTGESANTGLNQMKQGKHFMEPAQWFQLFAECLDKAITELNLGEGKQWRDMNDKERKAILANEKIDKYLLDASTWTQFPDYRKQFGYVLSLFWHSYSRWVLVNHWIPSRALGSYGVRPSIG